MSKIWGVKKGDVFLYITFKKISSLQQNAMALHLVIATCVLNHQLPSNKGDIVPINFVKNAFI